MTNEIKLHKVWTISKWVYGLVPVLIGLDKFSFLIVNWNMYVSPFAASIIPIIYLVPIVGIIEVIAGLLILTHWQKFGAFLVATWIGIVIVNLLLIGGFYDIILRDIAIAFGYIVFGMLTEIKETFQQYQNT